MYKLPPIPAPPVTVNAPVEVEVAAVELVTDSKLVRIVPVATILLTPPMLLPTLPLIVNAPAKTVPVAQILATPVILLLPDPENTKAANVPVLYTFKEPPIPTPPATTNAPVFVDVELAVLLIVTVPAFDITTVAELAGPPLQKLNESLGPTLILPFPVAQSTTIPSL